MALFELKIEIVASGVTDADETLLAESYSNWSVLEDVIAKRAWLMGIGETESALRHEWEQIESTLGTAQVTTLGEPVLRALADVDWRDSYKAHFHAWQFGHLHWVPVWERATFTLSPGDAVLWLDPGLAFGTGNHETTRLCVERLSALADDKSPSANRCVIDAGCGSGILALSAVLLGFGKVVGFDNDPEAVRISQENAALNGLTNRVRFFVGDLVSGFADEKNGGDVVLANIQADVLMRFAPELVAAVRPGGTLILSGILAGENAQVRQAFEAAAPGWPVNARTMGEWSDVVLTRT